MEDIAIDVKVKLTGNETRGEVCDKIKNKFLELEKYSTGKNKLTYVMVPKNHPIHPFPYNLEDRIDYLQKIIKDNIKFKLDIDVKKDKITSGEFKGNHTYIISIKNDSKLKEFEHVLKEINAKLEKGKWIIVVN